MSLYERLSPEALATLEQERKTYPATAEVVEEALKSHNYIVDIPLGVCQSIALTFNFKCNLLNLIEFFE